VKHVVDGAPDHGPQNDMKALGARLAFEELACVDGRRHLYGEGASKQAPIEFMRILQPNAPNACRQETSRP